MDMGAMEVTEVVMMHMVAVMTGMDTTMVDMAVVAGEDMEVDKVDTHSKATQAVVGVQVRFKWLDRVVSQELLESWFTFLWLSICTQ